MKALVTGFDAFGWDRVNSSFAVSRLAPNIGELDVSTRTLPTSFARSLDALLAAVDDVQPQLVLCVGQAAGRAELCLERVAINVQDARLEDNDGRQPIGVPVIRGGPAAYFSTLPVKACVAEMRRAGLPAAVSNSAGTFVCNHVFYAAMSIAARREGRVRCGFLHVPYLPMQAAHIANTPSMSLDAIVRGIEIVLSVSATRRADIRSVEGRIS